MPEQVETFPKREVSQKEFFSSVSTETQEFLKYGWSLLTAFKGRGPRVLIDLHDDVGRYSKQQLAAMGVEPNRFERLGISMDFISVMTSQTSLFPNVFFPSETRNS